MSRFLRLVESIGAAEKKPFSINSEVRQRQYEKFLRSGNTSRVAGAVVTEPALDAGVYEVSIDWQTGQAVFERKAIRSDEILRFPDSRYNKIVSEIDHFWGLAENFRDLGLSHKRGVLLWGKPGCHAKGQRVIMFDGSLKAVEDVVVGDQLMGPDSQPRTVLQLVRGEDEMVEVQPTKGKPFVVNMQHILSVQVSGVRVFFQGTLNISVADVLKQKKATQDKMKLYRCGGLDFGEDKELPVPPYILGAWLGDGHTGKPVLTTMDDEIVAEWTRWAESIGHTVRKFHNTKASKAFAYGISNPEPRTHYNSNAAMRLLREAGVYEDKHIPLLYLTASRGQRLELLAGLLDTDGFVSGYGPVASAHASYATVLPHLAEQVAYLGRSLGFAVYVKKVRKGTKYNGKDIRIDAFNVNISGDLSCIPARLPRKQPAERRQIKDHLRTGFKLEPQGFGEYFGFVLDCDHLYLLDDFTVTHNCGKTCLIKQVVEDTVNTGNVVFYAKRLQGLAEVLKQYRDVEPARQVLVVLEDIDEMVQYHERELLELFDGDDQVSGVLYLATTNYKERLPPRVMRSGRFDVKLEVVAPPRAGRLAYFRHKLPRISEDELERIADLTEDFSFGQLREFVVAAYALKQDPKESISRIRRNFTESAQMRGRLLTEAGERLRVRYEAGTNTVRSVPGNICVAYVPDRHLASGGWEPFWDRGADQWRPKLDDVVRANSTGTGQALAAAINAAFEGHTETTAEAQTLGITRSELNRSRKMAGRAVARAREEGHLGVGERVSVLYRNVHPFTGLPTDKPWHVHGAGGYVTSYSERGLAPKKKKTEGSYTFYDRAARAVAMGCTPHTGAQGAASLRRLGRGLIPDDAQAIEEGALSWSGGHDPGTGKPWSTASATHGDYHVDPIASSAGRHRGYSLTHSNSGKAPSDHEGLWGTVDKSGKGRPFNGHEPVFRSPQQAKSAAEVHHASLTKAEAVLEGRAEIRPNVEHPGTFDLYVDGQLQMPNETMAVLEPIMLSINQGSVHPSATGERGEIARGFLGLESRRSRRRAPVLYEAFRAAAHAEGRRRLDEAAGTLRGEGDEVLGEAGLLVEALPSEVDSPKVEKRVLVDFKGKFGAEHPGATAVFEHGHWWVDCRCGAQWDAVDVGSGGFDFEQVSEGDEGFH